MTDPTLAVVVAALDALIKQRVAEALQARQAPGPRPEGLLTTREVAQRLGLKQDAALSLIARGLLPAVRPPGMKGWRTRPADLEAYLAGQSRGESPTSLDAHRQAKAAQLAAAALRAK